jgi:hypothetical protein
MKQTSQEHAMRTILKRLSALGAGTMLLACANFDQQVRSLATVPAAQQARLSADEAYVLGRQHHMARRFDAAVRYYQRALQASPAHVNARNGMATLHAERGELAQALALWQGLTTEAGNSTGAASAFLFSNLGYAHLLNGEYDQALAALEKACVLDPLNARAWQHMGGALTKLGQHERAELMYKQARALQKHDIKADYRAVSPDDAVAGQQWASTELRQLSAGVFELHRVERAPVAAKPALAPPPVPAKPASVASVPARHTVEIRNGNGVTGMARALARQIDGPGVRVLHLSNQRGFGVQRTRVEYQPGLRAAALQLADRFGPAALVEVDSIRRTELRLVIGRDRMRTRLVSRPAAQMIRIANIAPVEGQ